MKLYQLKRTQALPVTMNNAWEFLSDPKNLKKITPPHMGFQILNGTPEPMYAGQIIAYSINPFPFVKLTWVTEITHVSKPHYFVDEQRSGPYRFWHHQHHLTPIPNGTLMTDIVHLALPMGFLGRMMYNLVVRKELKQIFDFRQRKMEEIFGKYPGEINFGSGNIHLAANSSRSI
jgi:ligand-binding SRPBCC domain-containing protein